MQIRTWQQGFNLYPISRKELEDDPALKQNPGYN